MTLEKLLEGLKIKSTNVDLNREIKDIKINSHSVDDGDLFVCMKGVRDDGFCHLNEIKKNFVALTDRVPENSVEYVQVDSVREAYALVSANYFANPQRGMKFVAIVGTNGKTSTAHYINSILSNCGFKTGLIGTEGHYILGEKVAHTLTTPDPYELYSLLFRMRAKGVEIVVGEVSAHAIFLKKVCGLVADVAVFTNCSQDHLDFFKSYKDYEDVKMSYFAPKYIKKAVVNVDDELGKRIARKLENNDDISLVTYGLNNPADCFAIDVYEGIDGIRFVANVCDDLIDVKSSLYGEFNIYNLMATLSVCAELGIHGEALAHAVRKVKNVKGRFSVLRAEKGTIIIDYAHTPDGLQQLLSTARTITKSRLITVFGCGGERDKSKRALMSEIAENYSDYVVVTTDNPRNEKVEDILRDIEMGFAGRNYKCIPDRTEAIIHAIGEMVEGDTVVIAGKGNEEYLEVKGRRIPYSDFDVARRWGQAR